MQKKNKQMDLKKMGVIVSFGLIAWAVVLSISDNMPFDKIDIYHGILGVGMIVVAMTKGEALAFIFGSVAAFVLVLLGHIAIFPALLTVLSAMGSMYIFSKIKF